MCPLLFIRLFSFLFLLLFYFILFLFFFFLLFSCLPSWMPYSQESSAATGVSPSVTVTRTGNILDVVANGELSECEIPVPILTGSSW
jgi:hypothetical protein